MMTTDNKNEEKNASKIGSVIISRDIYKREQRLRYWINRVKHDSIPEEDKQDIIKFIEHQEQEQISSLRMVRCINANSKEDNQG